jgi:hypothetical protein
MVRSPLLWSTVFMCKFVLSCPSVLEPCGFGALGQPVGSATLGVAGIGLWFSEHALVTHLLARVPPSTDSHLSLPVTKRIDLLFFIFVLSQTIREQRNNIRQGRACFRRTGVSPLGLVWVCLASCLWHFQINPQPRDSRFRFRYV